MVLGAKVIYSSTYAGTVIGYGTGAHVAVKLAGDNRTVFVNPDSLRPLGDRGMTDDEIALLKHVSMFGSDGYPVRKVGRRWSWSFRSVSHPSVFPTKREATESFEAFVDILMDAYAGRL